jgi:hypothetical protein
MKASQKGSVMTEAILLAGLMTLLLSAIHLSGRWQFGWLNHYLHTQAMATAIALDHHRPSALNTLGVSLVMNQGEQSVDLTRTLAEREFALGSSEWLHLQRSERYKQHAWRVIGTGQAANAQAVTQRLAKAQVLWNQASVQSQSVITPLRASLESVDGVWRSRGDMSDWLSKWQVSVPSQYVKPTAFERNLAPVFDRILGIVAPWP